MDKLKKSSESYLRKTQLVGEELRQAQKERREFCQAYLASQHLSEEEF